MNVAKKAENQQTKDIYLKQSSLQTPHLKVPDGKEKTFVVKDYKKKYRSPYTSVQSIPK